MTAPLENVNEILARRLTSAGLDTEKLSETGESAVAALAPGIDAVLPALQDDPYALLIMAECLRSYADLCETYARMAALKDPFLLRLDAVLSGEEETSLRRQNPRD